VEQRSVAVGASHDHPIPPHFPATFGLGDRVRKKSGAAWQGRIVGWYCTRLTPEGYAVESEAHPGSVQIYPVSALERVP
jgi:dihydrofolate reductase (trimethoprim resistance protein)